MKKKKFNPNAGNVEKGIEFFNSTTGDLSNVSMGENMKLKEDISKFDLESFDEITSGMIDNLSDEDIDENLRFYNKVARALHMGNHPEKLIFYCADDYDYDFNLDQADTIGVIKREYLVEIKEFAGIEFVIDHYVCFIFANEDDAIKVLNSLKVMDESMSLNEENDDEVDYLKLFNEFANTSHILTKKGNRYELNIDPDYRDALTDEQAYEIITSDHPEDKLFDMVNDAYVDAEFYETRDMFDEFNKFLKNKNLPTNYDEYDIMDHLDVNYPYDHFLDQQFNCRIIVDTGDKDYDYTLNPNYDDSEIKNEKASIVWLAKQQGKTITDLNNAILGDVTKDKFLTSVYEEVENTSSQINALTFLCRATLREMIDFKENKSSITLNKPYMCGFFDPYNGGGSIMELVVDKVVIPYNVVDQFVPDVSSDGYYGVQEVYGLTGKAYDTQVSLSD